jgi:very-short-patch-repair endonuclease
MSVKKARSLRKAMSSSERIVWALIRERRSGLCFRRQVEIEGMYLDFYCPSAKVCVEIDGPYHLPEKDVDRDNRLQRLGVMTFRIPTDAIYEYTGRALQQHLDKVFEACSGRSALAPPPLSPPPHPAQTVSAIPSE